MPDGQIFATITHGVRTMPAYGPQVPVPDRWAIVAYVRALQLSQMAQATPPTGAEEVSTTSKAAATAATDYRIADKSPWAGAWKIAGGIGVLGLAAAAYGYTFDPERFAYSLSLRALRPAEPRARQRSSS